MKTAMLLAAGRGERLKPLTDTCPKALCLLNDTPLIDYHLTRLAASGFERVVINHAHLGGKIRQHITCNRHRYDLDIIYSPEPPGGLETGGGIVNALPLLGDELFLTVNADIYTDFDFSKLPRIHTELAHLVVVHKPSYSPSGDFGFISPHILSNQGRDYTFSGIACYHPKLFQMYQPGRFSMTPILRSLAEKQQLHGELYQGTWFDIGSIARLTLANQHFQHKD